MKSRALHIFSAAFLIASLLFAQVGVNFFHRNHDVHQAKSVSTPLKAGIPGIQKHGEHCNVCSVDVFNHAFVYTVVSTATIFSSLLCQAMLQTGGEWSFQSNSKGRAPPAL